MYVYILRIMGNFWWFWLAFMNCKQDWRFLDLKTLEILTENSLLSTACLWKISVKYIRAPFPFWSSYFKNRVLCTKQSLICCLSGIYILRIKRNYTRMQIGAESLIYRGENDKRKTWCSLTRVESSDLRATFAHHSHTGKLKTTWFQGKCPLFPTDKNQLHLAVLGPHTSNSVSCKWRCPR